ncbi:dinitrogenase iron-molybdenum cofactor biosynthesis protein [Clostridium algoriphilum]|uniref:NifB/NifX family molybdenum-iron cluster-binding protein n=1 Tax=Clostridium algoriphilum TaxID=198347 RepID=UPI001CF465FB|nr:NifB/NifX family molybdenum-iron cluster-binding protein [Clostridium algoriphilum]MCB2294821.1 dinitrogenase iron-molybdenum cofactor biosynthesis protein [Clostridium algoriphilum]
MSIKIAVGSSDGISIDQHFGSGRIFYIFELSDEGNYKFIETREVRIGVEDSVLIACSDNENTGCNSSSNSGCGSVCNSGGHDEPGLFTKINLISDCHVVLINQVGKGAEKLLLKNGIGTFEAKGSIEKAFSKLYIYYKRTKQLI